MSASPEGVAHDIIAKYGFTRDYFCSEEGRRLISETITKESWGLPPDRHSQVLEHIQQMI